MSKNYETKAQELRDSTGIEVEVVHVSEIVAGAFVGTMVDKPLSKLPVVLADLDIAAKRATDMFDQQSTSAMPSKDLCLRAEAHTYGYETWGAFETACRQAA
jgi:hypothetical protein